jgi:hypothetical protein
MYENGELAQALGVEQPEERTIEAQPTVGPRPLGIDNRVG